MKWLAAALLSWTAIVSAQPYPSKPIRFIVSFPPGGSSDLIARAIAPRMSERLGQPVVVENRAGAGGMIGVDAVAKAPPDGYTIGLAAAGALSSNIQPVSEHAVPPGEGPRADLDARDDSVLPRRASVAAFLVEGADRSGKGEAGRALVRPRRQRLDHASRGRAAQHDGAASELQAVPYKGSGPVSADVLGGQVPLGVVDVPSAIANVKAGKLRALAVTTKRRIAAAPEVPTFEEAGAAGLRGDRLVRRGGAGGHAGEIINRLNSEIRDRARPRRMSASARSRRARSPSPHARRSSRRSSARRPGSGPR